MQWKEIPGYEDLYEISEYGDIRRLSNSDAFKAGTLIKPFTDYRGYVRTALRKAGKAKSFGVHRLVMMAFVGLSPDLDVNHLDGVKGNNHVSNLEYCTRKENARHARDVLGIELGEKHGRSKLKNADIPIILRALDDGNSLRWIAQVFEVSASTIGDIKAGKKWRFLLGLRTPSATIGVSGRSVGRCLPGQLAIRPNDG